MLPGIEETHAEQKTLCMGFFEPRIFCKLFARSGDMLIEKGDASQMLTEQGSAALALERDYLFANARPRLLRLARLRGVAPDALEDVVQETLLVAWRKFDSLDSPEHAQRWLDEICRNICSRYRRASAQEAARSLPLFELFLPYQPDEHAEPLAAETPDGLLTDPVEALSRDDLLQLLQQALNLLPEQAREAVEMYYLRELPQREAAVRLGLSISALETRLHRARRQLRQILNGDLREEAAALDLPLDGEEPALGWRASGVWCYYCGRQRLHGSFETSSNGQRYLRMRCPGCSQRFGFDIVNGKGLVSVDHLRSFQPAFKHTMRGLSRSLLQSIDSGQMICKGCGRLTLAQVSGPKQQTAVTPDDPLARQFWIRGQCQHCGHLLGGFSADDAVYWSHPAIQAFMRQHPRWLNRPDLPLDYQGQSAILFRLADRLSSAQLDVIAHRQTLRVLATMQH
jgi:RNA polymerase sigma-70 factor (ECF subfamily)